MSQATFSIRMDAELKKEFDDVCEEMGMTATTAFNIFARTVVRDRKIPFEIKAQEEAEMTPSINAEALLKMLSALQEK